jgi:hypothetical protein
MLYSEAPSVLLVVIIPAPGDGRKRRAVAAERGAATIDTIRQTETDNFLVSYQ